MPEVIKNTFKPSIYNIIESIGGGKTMAFNNVTLKLNLWDQAQNETYEQIVNDQDFIEITDILRDLEKKGYIVQKDMDELEELKKHYLEHRFRRDCLTLSIAPTMACNFACDYCYQGKGLSGEPMTEDVQNALIDFIEMKSDELNHLQIAWYGGEPTLQKIVIENLSHRMIEICKKESINYSADIVTNGYLFDARMAEWLYLNKVKKVQFTLDGSPETHNNRRIHKSGAPTFTTILNNIAESVNNVPMTIVLRINIDMRNLYEDKMEELFDLLYDHQITTQKGFCLYFAPVDAMSGVSKKVEKITPNRTQYAEFEFRMIKKALEMGLAYMPYPSLWHSTCAAVAPNGYVLMPTGEMHCCWDTVYDAKKSVGSIFSVTDLNESIEKRKFLDWSPFDSKECSSCKHLPTCAGACALKFVHADQVYGASKTPCLPWKQNIRPKLILNLINDGLLKKEDLMYPLEHYID